ncbi:MAG TPA: hypothetical protein ENJ53_06970 [Phaeodactylibacter sp.]|nr:hypothetical protein [Phaeodactylibacter sp.]
MLLLVFGDWWSTLNGAEQAFWGISIVFSVLFVIQFVLSLIGLDFDHDVDFDVSADTDVGGDYSLDPSFSLFSVRSIIAFFTFFGWTGVLALNANLGTMTAVIMASASGLLAMSIVGYMMYAFSKLGESGTTDINEALFQSGEVYLTIPEGKRGQGKIHIKIHGSLREVDAITEGKTLPTGATIRVVEVLDDRLLLVEPVETFLEGEEFRL